MDEPFSQVSTFYTDNPPLEVEFSRAGKVSNLKNLETKVFHYTGLGWTVVSSVVRGRRSVVLSDRTSHWFFRCCFLPLPAVVTTIRAVLTWERNSNCTLRSTGTVNFTTMRPVGGLVDGGFLEKFEAEHGHN